MSTNLRELKDFPEYFVGEDGQIYSIKPLRNYSKDTSLRVLRGTRDRDGYKRVALFRGSEKSYKRVCRLVCETFHGKPPSLSSVTRHKDGSTDNDKPDNLEWGSPLDNSQDAKRHGTWIHGTKVNTNKLAEEDVIKIFKDNRKYTEIAEDFGVSFGTVGHIKQGHTWKHLGLVPPSPRKPLQVLQDPTYRVRHGQ